MGAQMQRRAYSRVCGAATAKRPAALGYAGAGPAIMPFPRLDTSCDRRVIVRNFLLKYVEFSHMTRFRCMKTFGCVGILLLGVFVTLVASAAPALTPDAGPIGIAGAITGDGFVQSSWRRGSAV